LQSALAVRKGTAASNPYLVYELLSKPIMASGDFGGTLSVKGRSANVETDEGKASSGKKRERSQSGGKGGASQSVGKASRKEEEDELAQKRREAAKKGWRKRKRDKAESAKEKKGGENEKEEIELSSDSDGQ
jgi:hypothetical protein